MNTDLHRFTQIYTDENRPWSFLICVHLCLIGGEQPSPQRPHAAVAVAGGLARDAGTRFSATGGLLAPFLCGAVEEQPQAREHVAAHDTFGFVGEQVSASK